MISVIVKNIKVVTFFNISLIEVSKRKNIIMLAIRIQIARIIIMYNNFSFLYIEI